MKLSKFAPRMLRGLCSLLASFTLVSALSAAERVHIVRRSETLSSVARKYGVSPAAIADRNELKSANQLRSGQRLIIPGHEEADTQSDALYTIKRGDSLEAIAKNFGVSPTSLAKHNDIDSPNKIVPGQTLYIPNGSKSSRRSSGLPRDLERTLDHIHSSERWRTIVIHHSGSNNDTPKSMDAYHHQRGMENGLAYHFVIGNGVRTGDGEIFITHRWMDQLDGGHLASPIQNRYSIGICLVGNFNLQSPTRKQMESLRALVAYLMDQCNVPKSRVVTHQEINTRPTACPGKRFPKSRVLAGM
jgi:LysM repeat protein